MRLTNAVICAARSAYYRVAEPVKLRYLRATNYPTYMPPLFGWATGDKWEPLVSVYVPTFNRADLLIDRSLKSVLAQTYTNLEIIVVADGCTDDTVKRVRALGDSRIKLVEIERRRRYPPSPRNHWLAGRVAAANVGLKHCSGAFIATLDDDDIWTDDHIERLLRFAQDRDFEFVSSFHETDRDIVLPYDVDGVRVGGVQTWLMRAYLKSFKWNIHCWRKRWNAVSDTDLQERFVKAGVRMGFYRASTAYVIPRPGETSVGIKAYLADPEKTERHFAF